MFRPYHHLSPARGCYHSFQHLQQFLYSSNEKGQGQACDIFRADWLPDPDAPYYTNDTAVQRTVPPSQYENGEWNKDGDCLRSRPSRRGEKRIQGIELYLHKLQMEEFERAAGAAGDDVSGGRAPEQVQGVDAGEVLHRVPRLRALVPARGHRYLERHAAPYVDVLVKMTDHKNFSIVAEWLVGEAECSQ
jgi:hypothetical protein